MKKLLLLAFLPAFTLMCASGGKPILKTASIEPTVVRHGDSLRVTVEFTGAREDIKEVSFIVREYPYDSPRRYLKPDPNTKKNIWVLEDVLPYEAPVQSYHLDFTAIDKDGKEIVSQGFEDQDTGHAGTLTFKVVE